jgi:hypothetical protein
MNRYRVAMAMGREEYEEAVREDTELLNKFGLQLLSVNSGVRAAVQDELKDGRINPWNVLTIDEKTWMWLRPLLVRLRSHEATPHLVVQTVKSLAAK